MISRRRAVLGLSLFPLSFLARPASAADAAAPAADVKSMPAVWGAEALGDIQRAFLLPRSGLYALEVNGPKRRSPAWIWDASIQLGALCSAARLKPDEYLPHVKAYAAALRSHRTTHKDRPGLDVNPPPKPPDRYYDDNAWIALSLVEAYELTRDPKDLALATDAYDFALSGEDSATFGGGIFWHEDQRKTKNACSSGPVMLAALRFYALDKNAKHLATARRLYEWTRKHLQDADGLVLDSIAVDDGKLDRRKFTYNSATLLRAGCLLYRITGEQPYLDEARRVAKACEKQFVRAADGVVTGSGKLAVKLIEAFCELAEVDKDDHWRTVVARCLAAVHKQRNAAGWYPQDWHAPPLPPDKPARLIDQSAAARAYWVAAEHKVGEW
jgi:uncharacterized protein YyaL (SSP411 family)